MTAAADLTECPKCFGTGTMPHKHIADGVCFLCAGACKVDEATAGRWLAKQGHIPFARSSEAPVPTDKVTMELDLGAVFGVCEVMHHYCNRAGQFAVRLGAIRDGAEDEDGEPVGGFTVWFSTAGGRVAIDQESLVNGMRYYGNDRAGQLRRALQTAIAA